MAVSLIPAVSFNEPTCFYLPSSYHLVINSSVPRTTRREVHGEQPEYASLGIIETWIKRNYAEGIDELVAHQCYDSAQRMAANIEVAWTGDGGARAHSRGGTGPSLRL